MQAYETVLLSAVTSYMDVIRDRQLVTLSQNNEDLLRRDLDATLARYKGGELTRTDVSQSEARLAQARAETISAWGNLEISNAAFERVTGLEAGEGFEFPLVSFRFPESMEGMIAEPQDNNPQIRQSKSQYEASTREIHGITGELWPQVSAFASYTKEYDPQPGTSDEYHGGTVGVRARLALYQAGLIQSRVRQAKSTAAQRESLMDETARAVREEVISRWHDLQSTRNEITARAAEAQAKAGALEGVREEERMGERDIQDVLDAEQNLLNARVALIRSRYNEIVAAYRLAESLGYLFPEKLGLLSAPYDYRAGYERAGQKIFSLDPK